MRERTRRGVWVHWVAGVAVIAAVAGVGRADDPQARSADAEDGAPAAAAIAGVDSDASGLPRFTDDLALLPASCLLSGAAASTAPEPLAGPTPWPPGGNCPAGRCTVDFDCAIHCYVPNCPPPCGACVWETSQSCSGYCFCR